MLRKRRSQLLDRLKIRGEQVDDIAAAAKVMRKKLKRLAHLISDGYCRYRW